MKFHAKAIRWCAFIQIFAAGALLAQTYNALVIPPTISGTTFNLWLAQTNKQFWTTNPPLNIYSNGAATVTYGYNGMQFWGPTLIMSNSDFVKINVTNNLPDDTTVHWHGLHIPAIMDGGPHQMIPAGTVWSPSFKMINSAATYWYHPHLHLTTQNQLTYGAGGFIIVKDAAEASLPLPRTYGVDDLPLALTSRRFLTNTFNGVKPGNQFAVGQFTQSDGSTSSRDNYGDIALVNGTYNAQIVLPPQMVRLRILNGEIQRGYNLGFSNSVTASTNVIYYVIGNDQGLLNAPVPVTRVKMMVGERIEILLNLTTNPPGSTVDLKAYNREINGLFQPTLGAEAGFPGVEQEARVPNGASGPENAGWLNHTNFTLLHIIVGTNQTANAITNLPATLVTNVYWKKSDATSTNTITVTGGNGATPGFTFNNQTYNHLSNNFSIFLNTTQMWTIAAGNVFSHSLHIHDVKFYIVARSGTQVTSTGTNASYESGWKDTVYVPRTETVSVIAKFDDFASGVNPFMFHCHFLNHEDGGMMGQFVVTNNQTENIIITNFTRVGATNATVTFKATTGTTYAVQFNSNLASTNWNEVTTVTSSGSLASFTETNTARLAQSVGFYRIVMPVISDPATMASAALLSKTSAAGITTAAKVDVYCGTPPKTILLSP